MIVANQVSYKKNMISEVMKKMWMIVICIGSSALTSIIFTRVLATRYFEIVDVYVQDMCEATKQFAECIKDINKRGEPH